MAEKDPDEEIMVKAKSSKRFCEKGYFTEEELNREYDELLEKCPKDVVSLFKAIEKGEKLPELSMDIPFKKTFDADEKAERLSKLLRMIFHFSYDVVSSLKNEPSLATIYSKKAILDILSKLSNGSVSNIEMQVAAQEFITKRIDVYCSDIIMMQYSIHEGMKKKDVNFNDIEKTYIAVLMKDSPALFKENESYIHRKLAVTDTGIKLPSLEEIVYIELDKCLQLYKAGKIPEQEEELAMWLSMIADVNDDFVKEKMKQNQELEGISKELEKMGKDKEELIGMLADKYEQAVRNSELIDAEKKGEVRGEQRGIKIGEERGMEILILDNLEEGIPKERIINKLQKRYQLSEEEAQLEFQKITSD